MRVGNRDRGNAAERVHGGDGGLVEQAYTIPEQIAIRSLHEKGALTDRERRVGVNAVQAGFFLAELIPEFRAHFRERCPLLAVQADELARVLANRARRWRLRRLRKLHAAGDADVVRHVFR